ncbi:TPA: dTDP-4-dehydrorhamnose reductase family protein [Yersinia enterocolitica]|uniref:dTDP-4-dehydrorhamnose reductase n=1 Tax=Yersinia enterocolitica TaxID=630 RepID=A0ABP1YEZ1_YEREN|nr:SDR family oxidoreductase [Yersinia enterocolitica]AOF14548.1 NAD(P)-dependent oxidoreductase [Yersinia enterocolitica]AOF18673.1 NAD(P)-dependent oxidoreductase [Yersinia enterocolitica]AOF23204.1 NAD(P)-dependent oxidoreductase [Yersinia enterocolitica]AOF26913.1 NAD(P)-dependent oxidoreductase [Yersinia enterocolitica]AOF31026.1 NAD(P)-dependent oxidoreductase [Yersinia enterocolitica]
MKRKILITGGTGMLGAYVTSALKDTDYNVIVTERNTLNLSVPEAIFSYITAEKPDVILHFAAETDVDLCEREPARAGIYNHLATEQIAQAAKFCGAWLLYLSSSNVFGGEGKLSYNELDIPLPMNYYGRSKLIGESSVRNACTNNHLIIRAGWMIGGGPDKDHKFVGKIIQQIKAGSTSIKAVSDRLGSITSAMQLCNFIIWAINKRHTGTLHFASSGTISRFDIACAIGDLLNFKGDIIPVHSSVFPLSAPRPYSEGIESIYMSILSDAPKPSLWKSDLAKYVGTFPV